MTKAKNIVIQCALAPEELPKSIARQIGPMYLKRYYPSPAVNGVRSFKDGLWKGCLAWALDETGKVLGWALRAIPRGQDRAQVMVFVSRAHRRKGIGDALLDCCRKFGPAGPVTYYPHSPESSAFYEFREKKLKRGI